MEDTKPTPIGYQAGDWRRHYALVVLAVVYALCIVDRGIVPILQEPIRQEFRVSDSALGLLSGLGFAVFYAGAGIPLGMLADRRNRRDLISVCLAAWSGMTAACGLALSFVQLLVARIAVGVGEAGAAPASMSMIADLYSREHRATAMSVFHLATPASMLVGFSAGGWIAQHYGWRDAFFVAGLPGLALAVVLRLTVSEPKRGQADGLSDKLRNSTIRETLTVVLTRSALLHTVAGIMLTSMAGAGIGTWIASFFIRLHGVTVAEIGPIIGVSFGVLAAIGTVAGGLIADRLGGRDDRWRLWIVALASLMTVPMVAGCVLAPGRTAAIMFYGGFSLFTQVWSGCSTAIAQGLVRIRMRSTIGAVVYLLIGLVGIGLGPLLTGILSDAFAHAFGADSLRYAMLAVGSLNIWAAAHFYLATRSLRQDLKAAAAEG